MNTTENMNKSLSLPPIYIISCGKGFAGNNLVQTVLVQFPENKIPVILIPNIVTVEQVEKAVNDIANTGGIVVHTMVDQHLRLVLNKICQGKKIKTIDLMVDLISYISEILEEKPLSQPGLFRKLNLEYFDRIESIEYTVSNDDGLSPQTLQDADIVLTGVSRTGKTPLSMYLAMFGWKVTNIPLIKDIPPPEELFKLDHKRVIGLNINLNQLLSHRRKRLQSFGNVGD